MDALIKAFDPVAKIRVTLVDVTMAAKALEARHLGGPTAALALGEALAAAALVSQDATAADEAVMFRLAVAGPLRAVMAEATGDGGLRGYTHAKVLNDLDGRAAISTDEAWGESGSAQIVTTRPGVVINQAALAVKPMRMRFVLARYFNASMQVPTAVDVFAKADAAGVLRVAAALAQRMVDTKPEDFVRVLERFEDGSVRRALETSTDPGFLKVLLGLPGLEQRESRLLEFRCRCSKERTLSVLEALAEDELDNMISGGLSQGITCHMCGQGYVASSDDLRAVLASKRRNPPISRN